MILILHALCGHIPTRTGSFVLKTEALPVLSHNLSFNLAFHFSNKALKGLTNQGAPAVRQLNRLCGLPSGWRGIIFHMNSLIKPFGFSECQSLDKQEEEKNLLNSS